MVQISPYNIYFDSGRGVYFFVGKVANAKKYGLGKIINKNGTLISIPKRTIRYAVKGMLRDMLSLGLEDEEKYYDYPEEEWNLWLKSNNHYLLAGQMVDVVKCGLSHLVGKNERMIEVSKDSMEYIAQKEIDRKLRKGFLRLKAAVAKNNK